MTPACASWMNEQTPKINMHARAYEFPTFINTHLAVFDLLRNGSASIRDEQG
jgi:hypothetical protein